MALQSCITWGFSGGKKTLPTAYSLGGGRVMPMASAWARRKASGMPKSIPVFGGRGQRDGVRFYGWYCCDKK